MKLKELTNGGAFYFVEDKEYNIDVIYIITTSKHNAPRYLVDLLNFSITPMQDDSSLWENEIIPIDVRT